MISKLENIRVSRKMSQRALADKSSVHQQTISRIEQTGVLNSLSVARKLSAALGCKVSDIMDIDAGIDSALEVDVSNLNNYIKVTRELLNISSRRIANLLDMNEDEYLDCEDNNNDLPREDALDIAAVMFNEYVTMKLSTELHKNSQPIDLSDNEARALQELRALSPENQEKFINLISATTLLK